MAHGEANPDTGDLARLTVSAGAALALFGAVLLAVIAYAGWTDDRIAYEQESTLIENTLNEAVERSLSEQKSVAWWDTAVTKTAEGRLDAAFLDTEFGQLLTETYRQSEIYVLDSRDRPVYGFAHAQRISPTQFERHRAAMAPIISEIRGRPAAGIRQRPDLFGAQQSNYRVLAAAMSRARWTGHIVSLEGRPAIVTAITIIPNVDLELLHGPPPVLVSVTYIDDAMIAEIGRSLLLPDLRLAAAPHGAGFVSKPFVTDDGAAIGVLSWTTKQPGEVLLKLILPLVAIALAAAGAIFGNMLLNLKRALSGLAQSELQARHDALHDTLSGLPNRQHFLSKLAETIAESAASGRPLMAAYIDIDRFKDINDTMGHHAGDILIKAVAERLQSHILAEDFLARFGGDEFAIFSTAPDDADGQKLAGRLAQAFAKPIVIDGQGIRVTGSVGIAVSPEHGENCDDLMRHADIALYEAKTQGRNRAILFAAGMGELVAQRRAIEVDLREAIEANKLDLHFQPVISARTGKIMGAEALVRWAHPRLGPMSPAAFIPIAEESGLMPALGDWVLRRALKASRRWPNLSISINLSPVQFRHTDLRGQLQRLMDEYDVDPRNIVLEITEGVLLESNQRTKQILDAIRAMGCKIALDDFGTGYSSLAYLCEFRFDKIKIDHSFVAGFARGEVPRSVLSAVSALGRGLGMDVVAEGVETEFDAVAMRHLGCTEMQGYYFSKAVDVRSFDALLANDLAVDPRWLRAPLQSLRS